LTNLGFTLSNLSYILLWSGTNALSILRDFHTLCVHEKKEYLNHFLAQPELFDLNKLSKLLRGEGLKVCPIFEEVHDLCFGTRGKKTEYLDSLFTKCTNDDWTVDFNGIFNELKDACKKLKRKS